MQFDRKHPCEGRLLSCEHRPYFMVEMKGGDSLGITKRPEDRPQNNRELLPGSNAGPLPKNWRLMRGY